SFHPTQHGSDLGFPRRLEYCGEQVVATRLVVGYCRDQGLDPQKAEASPSHAIDLGESANPVTDLIHEDRVPNMGGVVDEPEPDHPFVDDPCRDRAAAQQLRIALRDL